jgi:hypothetical protein
MSCRKVFLLYQRGPDKFTGGDLFSLVVWRSSVCLGSFPTTTSSLLVHCCVVKSICCALLCFTTQSVQSLAVQLLCIITAGRFRRHLTEQVCVFSWSRYLLVAAVVSFWLPGPACISSWLPRPAPGCCLKSVSARGCPGQLLVDGASSDLLVVALASSWLLLEIGICSWLLWPQLHIQNAISGVL